MASFFFGAEMLLEKNFHFAENALEWAATAVITVVFVSLFEIDAFGLSAMCRRWRMWRRHVRSIWIYPVQVKGEELATLTELQRQIIANRMPIRR